MPLNPARCSAGRACLRSTKPLVDDLRLWLEAQLAAVSGKSTIAGAIRYALSRWEGLTRFLDDGRIEIDSNVVERSIRPIALGRKNHLFAGSDGGGEQWAVIASPSTSSRTDPGSPVSRHRLSLRPAAATNCPSSRWKIEGRV